MSTKMYVYQVEKEKFWDVIKQIREFYEENHVIFKAIRRLVVKDSTNYSELMEIIARISESSSAELQVFETAEHYYVRALESGYFFMNNCDKFNLIPIFYDNRTEIPEEMEKYEYLVDVIDEMIKVRHYLICPLVNEEISQSYLWDYSSKICGVED